MFFAGSMLSIGRSNYMRFNHPLEAKHLKSVLPNSRISMTPISFTDGHNENSNLDRKPPVAPRKSPRNSCSDEDIGFLSKLTKFEMLSRQNRNCVSPKVFPAGGLTANVPADQILSNSSTSLQKNGTWHLQNSPNPEEDSGQPPLIYNNDDLMSRSMIYQRPAVDHYPREFDMSQSLIVTKTTTTTEFLQLDKCSSNPSVCNRQVSSYDNTEPCTPISRKIQPPSPAFNRNPTKYSEHKIRCYAQRTRAVKSPAASSLEELRDRQLDVEANRRKQAMEERLREQEIERQEKIRLEEILTMCAEYERQSINERPRQPVR